ncbi:MAG: hypothetical protein J7639_32255 [Paenibacillaceae bacterium]|nr:hypothetical protein [Paenibacillaceae bacterium]
MKQNGSQLRDHYPLSVSLARYENNEPVQSVSHLLPDGDSHRRIEVESSLWNVDCTYSHVAGNPEAIDCKVTFQTVQGDLHDANVSVRVHLSHWSKENYVLMPAAAYNGNRFLVSKQDYPPMLDEQEREVDIPTYITDVPRLELEEGKSSIYLCFGRCKLDPAFSMAYITMESCMATTSRSKTMSTAS